MSNKFQFYLHKKCEITVSWFDVDVKFMCYLKFYEQVSSFLTLVVIFRGLNKRWYLEFL